MGYRCSKEHSGVLPKKLEWREREADLEVFEVSPERLPQVAMSQGYELPSIYDLLSQVSRPCQYFFLPAFPEIKLGSLES